jgi:hypothetical protein
MGNADDDFSGLAQIMFKSSTLKPGCEGRFVIAGAHEFRRSLVFCGHFLMRLIPILHRLNVFAT